MKPVRQTCQPRPEVLTGDLSDALFAADFFHVVEGTAPPVYQDPVLFFRNTHPAAQLKKVVTTVFERLANPEEPGATVRLSTGFGGGKTHALIALWHLARHVDQPTLGTELLPAAGRPPRVAVAGVDAARFGAEVCAKHGQVETHSLWGELAYRLGGEPLYRQVADFDHPHALPDAGTLRALLPPGPTLLLLDELVIYMSVLDERARKALLAFLNMLMAEVTARPQAVLVMTDPAEQRVYEEEASAIAEVTAQLDDVLGRRVSDYDPIGGETAEVVLRRLFERVDRDAAQEASAEYYNAYQRIHREYPDALPSEAATLDYAQEIARCYPFHPRLLVTARDRLGALQDFNKSRGTLRLFARILRDLWESGGDIGLITAGDLDWTSPRIQADLLSRLNRDSFKPAVDADVVRHAARLDQEYGTDIHRRVATALLLESIPLTPTSGMDKRDLALAVLRPSDVGNEPGEAVDRLMSICWHTYKDESGTRFQFRYEPNANKIIEERAELVPSEDARQAVFAFIQGYFGGHTFRLVAFPPSPRAVSDEAALQLVLVDREDLAQAICDYQDDSDPAAKFPRRFRNSIFAVAPSPNLLDEAIQSQRRVRAAEQILEEEKRKSRSSPLRQEVERLLPAFRLSAQRNAIRAFNRVFFHGRKGVTLAEKYLVPSTGALGSVSGQAKLKEFLDDNGLVYQPGDALDVDLLLEHLLPGATPSLDHEGAYLASSVHERALSHPDLKLMLDAEPVRRAVLHAVAQGRLVVRLPNGDAYDGQGCVSGPPGARTRDPNRPLQTLALQSDVLLAPPDAPCVAQWLRVDEPPSEERLLPLAEAAALKSVSEEQIAEALDLGHLDERFEEGERKVVANERFWAWVPRRPSNVARTWEEALALAEARPLLQLKLVARTLAGAKRLLAVAQPFGARSLTLSLTASGSLKTGGEVRFAVDEVPHNHPLKPVERAEEFLRACREGTTTCEALLTLEFEPGGRRDTAPLFQRAQGEAGTEVRPEALFGEEGALV